MYLSDYEPMGKFSLKKVGKKLKKVVKKVAPVAVGLTTGLATGVAAGKLTKKALSSKKSSNKHAKTDTGVPYSSMSVDQLIAERARLNAKIAAGKNVKEARRKLSTLDQMGVPVASAADSSVPGATAPVPTFSPPIAASATTFPAPVAESVPPMQQEIPVQNFATSPSPYQELEPIDITAERTQSAGFGGGGLLVAGLIGLAVVMSNSGGRRKGARRGEI